MGSQLRLRSVLGISVLAVVVYALYSIYSVHRITRTVFSLPSIM